MVFLRFIPPASLFLLVVMAERASVFLSPSGKIMEGSSVTLTCSSDANPPAHDYTWYKGANIIRTGQSYIINKVSFVHSGVYKCRARNHYGEKYSDAATLNVLYPPRSVSVSISPSGEIIEGSSVTLTCSSDANPPAELIWFKGKALKNKGSFYTINRISSEDGGVYKCKSFNQHGEKYSHGTTVNVLYPPKNVSVSISSSGEMVEGSSVTLTCSSDANPPVHDYTWYKVNVSSAVGSGQSYSFTLGFRNSGLFYCVAQNKYGTQRSATVPLLLNEVPSWFSPPLLYVAVGGVVCGLPAFIAGRFCESMKKKEKSNMVKHDYVNAVAQTPHDSYITLDSATRSPDGPYSTLATITS